MANAQKYLAVVCWAIVILGSANIYYLYKDLQCKTFEPPVIVTLPSGEYYRTGGTCIPSQVLSVGETCTVTMVFKPDNIKTDFFIKNIGTVKVTINDPAIATH